MDDESRIELPRALDFKRLDFVVFKYNEGFEVWVFLANYEYNNKKDLILETKI
jgi:hypothetical protein